MFILLFCIYTIIAILSGRFIIFPTLDLVRKISFVDSFYEESPFSDNVLMIAAIIVSIVIAIIIFLLVKEYVTNTVWMFIDGALIPLITFIVIALLLILVAAAYWILIIIGIISILAFILVLDTFEDII